VTDEPAHGKPLAEADLGPNPLQAFAAWFAEAGEAGVRMPEAVALATATRAGAPSARMVLLKGFDDAGFVFYTNYESRKARELAENPQAALLFYWDELGRQVRIDGAVEKVARAESEAYFASRPPGSQLSALASRQSEVIASRAKLETRVARLRDELAGADVPFPASWGGYRLAPVEYEFWQHREDRLHDRLRYRPAAAGGWLLERLQP
jgi:pyridoxamine 5'-phosphate oxidase